MNNIYIFLNYLTLGVENMNRRFSMYLLATSITAFGSFLSSIAILLLIYQWTTSGLILSFFELASVSPPIALGVLAGQYLQGKDSRKVWITMALISGFFELFVVLFFNIYSLFLLNLVVSTNSIFVMVSKGALLPKIVKPEELGWANNTIFLSYLVIGAISPFIAAYFLSLSPLFPFVVDLATYFLEALAVYFISVPAAIDEKTGEKKQGFLSGLRGSFSTLRREAKIVLYALLFANTLMFLGGANKLLIVGYIHSYFPAHYYLYYGIRATLVAVGMMAILVPITFKKIEINKPYAMVLYSSIFLASFYLMIGVLVNPLILFSSAVILGIGDGLISPQFQTILMKYTPPKILKPTLGLTTTVTKSAQLISIITAGVLMTFVDTKTIFLAFGIIVLFIFLFFLPTKKLEK